MTSIKFSFHGIIADMDSVRLVLTKITLPILWNNKGRFGLIPFARIKNALEYEKDVLNAGLLKTVTREFHWHDVIKISPQIANALLGEDKDDKCTYRSKDSPNTSGTDS